MGNEGKNGRCCLKTICKKEEAAELAKRCKAACLIPMHHDLYAINGCRENWVREAAADAGVPVRILRCGEHIAFF